MCLLMVCHGPVPRSSARQTQIPQNPCPLRGPVHWARGKDWVGRWQEQMAPWEAPSSQQPPAEAWRPAPSITGKTDRSLEGAPPTQRLV